ncbi:MAG: YxeA family protein [Ruminococcus sp.]|nr:YxeA family protein [Ruminococcus sp.]
MKGKFLIVTVIVAALLCGVVGGVYYWENYDVFYYAQIDDSKAVELDAVEDMQYEYTLTCYNEDGKQKELTFKTHKRLKDDAYILLEVRSAGVHKWEEVQFDNLPQTVQKKIK